MKESAQIEAMARLEGKDYTGFWCDDCGDINGANTTNDEHCALCGKPAECNFSDYLHDHNAVQRVIDGLDLSTLERYVQELEKVTHASVMTVTNMVLAACPQKVEAILKACGKWEDK